MTNNFTPAKAGQQSKRLSKEEYAEKMKAENQMKWVARMNSIRNRVDEIVLSELIDT